MASILLFPDRCTVLSRMPPGYCGVYGIRALGQERTTRRVKAVSAIMKGGVDDPHCLRPGYYQVIAPALGCMFDIPFARNGCDALEQAKGFNKGEQGSLSQLDLRGRTRRWNVTRIA
jgi:hypothetical protein